MDLILLGLLMVKASTLYEMKKAIETNMTTISSGSMGSIQATIKKLLDKKLIGFSEHIEHSVNKKVYQITAEGKAYFYASISQPMQYKEKSMELGKFFFLGFVDQSKRSALIDSYIAELNKQLSALEQVKEAAGTRSGFDEAYVSDLRAQGAVEDLTLDDVHEIAFYQLAMLDFSMAKLRFELEWFVQFRQTMRKEGGFE